jgi:hypothetical protein
VINARASFVHTDYRSYAVNCSSLPSPIRLPSVSHIGAYVRQRPFETGPLRSPISRFLSPPSSGKNGRQPVTVVCTIPQCCVEEGTQSERTQTAGPRGRNVTARPNKGFQSSPARARRDMLLPSDDSSSCPRERRIPFACPQLACSCSTLPTGRLTMGYRPYSRRRVDPPAAEIDRRRRRRAYRLEQKQQRQRQRQPSGRQWQAERQQQGSVASSRGSRAGALDHSACGGCSSWDLRLRHAGFISKKMRRE